MHFGEDLAGYIINVQNRQIQQMSAWLESNPALSGESNKCYEASDDDGLSAGVLAGIIVGSVLGAGPRPPDRCWAHDDAQAEEDGGSRQVRRDGLPQGCRPKPRGDHTATGQLHRD